MYPEPFLGQRLQTFFYSCDKNKKRL